MSALRDERAFDSATAALLVGVVLIGLALRLTGLDWGLPNERALGEPPFHPDEKVAVAQGAQLYSKPTGTTFIWGGALYMRTAHLVHKVALASSEGRHRDGGLRISVRALRRLNVVFSLITVVIVAAIAGRLFGPIPGVVAAALMAFVPGPLLDAHYARPDSLLCMLCAASLACAVRVALRGGTEWLLAGAFLGGLATATMLSGVTAFVPLAVAAFEWRRTRPDGPPADAGEAAVSLARSGALIAGGALAGWLAGTFEALLFPGAFGDGLGIAQRTHSNAGFTIPTQLMTSVSAYSFGLPVTLLGYAGLFLMLRRRSPGMLTLASALITGYVLLGRVGGQMMRHLEFIAPATIVAAVFALGVLARAVARSDAQRTSAVAILAGVTVLWTLQLSAAYVLPMQTDVDQRYRAGNWIAENTPDDAVIGLTTSFAYDWTYSPRLPIDATQTQKPIMLRRGFDASGSLDGAFDFIAISDFVETHARNASARAFVTKLLSGSRYTPVHREGTRFDPLCVPDWFGSMRPSDLHYTRSTFTVFRRN